MSTHRKFKPQLKFKVVVEAIKGEKTHSEIARQYSIHPQLVVNWKKEFFERGPTIFEGGSRGGTSKKVDDLEKIIGQQTIEIQLLKKFLGHAS